MYKQASSTITKEIQQGLVINMVTGTSDYLTIKKLPLYPGTIGKLLQTTAFIIHKRQVSHFREAWGGLLSIHHRLVEAPL